MTVDREQIADLFSAFGTVDVRRMFGGFGVYAEAIMFAIAHDGVIYLKADETSRGAFEREGQGAFTYPTRDGKRVALSYWRLPERLYDDPDELADWTKAALAAARRAQMKTPRKRGGKQAAAIGADGITPPASASTARSRDRSRR
jgi:DNA transformation protein and related proteins